jgi:hypothetical protein
VLESLDITVEDVRGMVARIVGQGDELTTSQIPFTPRAKKVLELSLREALSLGHNYIGTEHVLLGLVTENEGVAARILLDFDADAEKIRAEVIRMLSGAGRPSSELRAYEPKSPPLAPEFATELERVRAEKEQAIETREFERAASLRDRERALGRAGRRLEQVWEGRADREQQFGYAPVAYPAAVPVRSAAARMPLGAIFAGWILFGAALGIGLLVGWLIWG